jgi:predicted  nucleic acid-binding Zn-ribbon protein
MHPGFQEEAQARRRVEDELESVEKERDSLRAKVRHLESELDGLRSRSVDAEPEPDGHVVPLSRR